MARLSVHVPDELAEQSGIALITTDERPARASAWAEDVRPATEVLGQSTW